MLCLDHFIRRQEMAGNARHRLAVTTERPPVFLVVGDSSDATAPTRPPRLPPPLGRRATRSLGGVSKNASRAGLNTCGGHVLAQLQAQERLTTHLRPRQ